MNKNKNRKINSNKEFTIFLILFFGISLTAFWVFNGEVYANEIKYRIMNSLGSNEETVESIVELARQESAPENPIITSNVTIRENKNYVIAIPKINITAPVVFPPSDTLEEITKSLDHGVVLYPGSVMPGQGGRGVILGHSSRAIWNRADFSSIFSLLNRLDPGDEFYILENNNKKYVYEIFSKQFLSPEQTNDVLAGPYVNSEFNLITCYPIGSPSQRTLIRSTLLRVEDL